MPSHLQSRADAAGLLVVTALGFASLWDFRVFDIRIFDTLSILLLLGFLLLYREPVKRWIPRRRDFLLLFTIVALYAVLGYLLHEHRSSVAILFLSMFGLHLAGRQDWLAAMRFCKLLIFLHIAFFFVQFLAFYGLGTLIDFHKILGQESRIIRSLTEIRAAGLFLEPNSYCLNLFVLTSIAVLHQPSRILAFVAATSMLLSQSLWGGAAAIVLIFLNEMSRATSLRQMAAGVTALTIGAAAIFNVYIWMTKPRSDPVPFFYLRIADILKDPSLYERYMRSYDSDAQPCNIPGTKVAPNTAAHMVKFTGLPTLSGIAGEGLTTKFFIECLPANGLAFLFKSFGALGLAALAFGLSLALRGVTVAAKIFVVVSLAFAFTSYPLVTYVLFWIWFPALLLLARLRSHVPGAASPRPEAGSARNTI